MSARDPLDFTERLLFGVPRNHATEQFETAFLLKPGECSGSGVALECGERAEGYLPTRRKRDGGIQ